MKRARRLPASRRARAPPGHLGEELGAERALALLDAAALLADLFADLLARLVPQTGGARRGERLHLQRRVRIVQADRDDALGLLLDLEAEVQAFPRQDLDAAEVDVGADRVRLGLVERAGGLAVGQRGLRVRAPESASGRGGVWSCEDSVLSGSRWSRSPRRRVTLPGERLHRDELARDTGITMSWAMRSPTAM